MLCFDIATKNHNEIKYYIHGPNVILLVYLYVYCIFYRKTSLFHFNINQIKYYILCRHIMHYVSIRISELYLHDVNYYEIVVYNIIL